MTETVTFASEEALSDLRQFSARLGSVGASEVRLQGVPRRSGGLLVVTGPVLAPTHLLDSTPLVLGLRATQVRSVPEFNRVVELQALADRFAHQPRGAVTLACPPAEVHAAWAGRQPPVDGWKRTGSLDVPSLIAVSRDGAQRIAAALPEQPGQALTQKVRSSIWSLPIAEGVPSGGAFALETLGFTRGANTVEIWRSGPWTRLAAPGGAILIHRTAQKFSDLE